MITKLRENVGGVLEEITLQFPITESQAQKLLALVLTDPGIQQAIKMVCDLILMENDEVVPDSWSGASVCAARYSAVGATFEDSLRRSQLDTMAEEEVLP